ncbi:MAG: hypothetical protein JSR83_00840 [Proteobacteria bacterium]|nr:hypothetical protein [Pseudomonadota bacterium]
MDEEKWKTLDALLMGLEETVKAAAPGTRTRSVLSRVEGLRGEFSTARTASDTGVRDRIDMAVHELWSLVENWGGVGPGKPWHERLFEWAGERLSFTGLIGLVVLVVVLALLVVGIWMFASKVGWAELATIDGTRPILTMAAIIATLAYGGGLIFSALFSNEGKFEERFRMAREIFLVFSGVFATIVGFHFGSQGSQTPSAEVLQLDVKSGEKPGDLELSVVGGEPPYTVTTQGSNIKPVPERKGQSPFRISFSALDATSPATITFSVVDKSGKKKGVREMSSKELGELTKPTKPAPSSPATIDSNPSVANQPATRSDVPSRGDPPVTK